MENSLQRGSKVLFYRVLWKGRRETGDVAQDYEERE